MSDLLTGIKNKALTAVLGIAENLVPVLKESKFRETGFLTPDEFVAAGNFLVHHCPTWQWASGDKLKIKDYLPKDKQFLITKNVPCTKRCKHLMDVKDNIEKVIEEETGDGGWVDTHFHDDPSNRENATAEEIDDTSPNEDKNELNLNKLKQEAIANLKTTTTTTANNKVVVGDLDDDEDDDEPVDMESYDHNVVDDDEATVTVLPNKVTTSTDDNNININKNNDDSTTIPTRTYDLNITYDNYYRTPRLWLSGYDENNKPLTVDQMYEDISEDHAKKTVTFEAHPHIPNTQMASIHPCRHAEVMKKLINLVAESGKELEVYNYLTVFLKFVQSVIPTVEYDYTRNFSI